MAEEDKYVLPVPTGEPCVEDFDELLAQQAAEDDVSQIEDHEEFGSTDVPNDDLTDSAGPDDSATAIPPDEGDDEAANKYLHEPEDKTDEARLQVGVLRLSEKDRSRARRLSVRAAILGLHHAPQIHYTQGSRRWEGIADTRLAHRGEYPNFADCSAFATWCLWNGLYVPFHSPDVVNGQQWKAGFTGTMLDHGIAVRHLKNVRWGDCVIYGRAGTSGRHTAIIARVGHPRGSGVMVVSHGSEKGPFFLKYNYRTDIQSIRRFIR